MAIVLDVCHFSALLIGSRLTSNRGQWLGWTGLINVDGNTFVWMGAPDGFNDTASQTSYEYTSTRSIFTMSVDSKVQLRVTFLSPLTPNDFKRQSLIFSYMEIEVSSLDDSKHDVHIYTDISAGGSIFLWLMYVELTCGQNGYLVMWLIQPSGVLALHRTVSTTTRSGSKTNKSSTNSAIEHSGAIG
jgi:hypothetical protein